MAIKATYLPIHHGSSIIKQIIRTPQETKTNQLSELRTQNRLATQTELRKVIDPSTGKPILQTQHTLVDTQTQQKVAGSPPLNIQEGDPISILISHDLWEHGFTPGATYEDENLTAGFNRAHYRELGKKEEKQALKEMNAITKGMVQPSKWCLRQLLGGASAKTTATPNPMADPLPDGNRKLGKHVEEVMQEHKDKDPEHLATIIAGRKSLMRSLKDSGVTIQPYRLEINGKTIPIPASTLHTSKETPEYLYGYCNLPETTSKVFETANEAFRRGNAASPLITNVSDSESTSTEGARLSSMEDVWATADKKSNELTSNGQ